MHTRHSSTHGRHASLKRSGALHHRLEPLGRARRGRRSDGQRGRMHLSPGLRTEDKKGANRANEVQRGPTHNLPSSPLKHAQPRTHNHRTLVNLRDEVGFRLSRQRERGPHSPGLGCRRRLQARVQGREGATCEPHTPLPAVPHLTRERACVITCARPPNHNKQDPRRAHQKSRGSDAIARAR